jgi:hypothetical protein
LSWLYFPEINSAVFPQGQNNDKMKICVDENLIKLYSIETRHSEVETSCYERFIERYNQVAFQ